jgi:serine/threonine protein kinase
LYLVTDYCPGGDFRALINNKRQIGEELAKIYLAEILLAISVIHKNGIIHRDIKPDNVLIDEQGHACLTDFGLAKEGMFEKKLTQTMLGGGQSYQIPEVLLWVPYDKTVDLYLFGLLAYELMAGKVAFAAGDDCDMVVEKIMKGDYEKPIFLSREASDMI